MEITDELWERIVRHEGIRYSPYTDSVGQETIGVGHAITEAEKKIYFNNCEISEREVFYLLHIDINDAARSADDLIGDITLPIPIREVIIEMVFQLGKRGVSKFKRMWAALKKGDFAEAGYEMRDSKWFHQTQSRCIELAKIVENIKNID